MDLNNQMVLMRRNIKRAKIHVISKLVRRIKNLRNKKGNEGDRRTNSTRADRLLEEIDLIKDMKCDDIFKRMLLVELGDIGKVEELKDRALLRIAAVSFIKPKIIELKNQLQHFDVARSKKDRTTSTNVAQKLDKISMGALREEKQQTEQRDEDVQRNLEDQGVGSLGTKDVGNSMSLNGGSDELVEHQSIAEIHPGVDNVLSQDRGNSPGPEDFNNSDTGESPQSQDFDESGPGESPGPQDLDGSDPGESPEPQNLDDGSTEFVLPEFYRQQNALEEKRDALKMMMSSGDDITDVLENIGKDFLPCDVTEEEEGSEDDPFFMEETEGSIDQAEPNKLTTKSVFLSSLSGRRGGKPPYTKPQVAHKKKNRLGQRARKKLHGKEHLVKHGNFGKRKAPMRPTKTKVAKIAPKVGNIEPTNLHPSWQASQAKKKQNSIQKFEGTRIRFDD